MISSIEKGEPIMSLQPVITDLIESTGFERLVRVPLCHQETPYTCGVACVQSLLAGYGIFYTQDILAEQLKQKPIYGTDYRRILSFMELLGFQSSYHSEMNIDILKNWIKQGITPILLLQAWKDSEIDYSFDWKDSHYAIACGYDEERIVFMDPWILGNYVFIPNNRLLERWHGIDGSGNRCPHSGLIIQHDQLPYIYNPDKIKPMN
jgi:ABC-type bacteriocin/lantibiotic exporter with double-glycine peptidase domain